MLRAHWHGNQVTNTQHVNIIFPGLYAVTANLNVNYRKFIPLKSIVMCEANVSKLDGRKVYIDAQVKSLDGAIVHADATALFIQIDASKLPKKQ